MSLFSKKKSNTEEKSEKKKKEMNKEELSNKQTFLNNKNILLIKQPRVTEKSQMLKQFRQYAFDVVKNANKNEIKKAIEKIYNVKVEKIRVINIPFKKRRLGVLTGRKSAYKKAIIILKEGYQIEVIPQK